MKGASPLRYPGGKSAMTGLLRQIKRLNRLGDRSLAEPFAGGAGASLSMLFLEETTDIYINDLDPAIRDFWWALTHRPLQFMELLSATRVNMTEWRRQRDVYRSRNASKIKRGFAAFYLNRCNRSGIIMNGGPIGGVRQTGKWKLNARYNKRELIKRCQRIVEFRQRIHVSGMDAIAFISERAASKTLFFVDPPYFHKGNTLYLNAINHDYHQRIGDKLRSLRDASWVLTYDDCPEIREIYRGWSTIRPFSLQYAASDYRSGKEILIAPKWMRLPDTQQSLAISW